MSIYAVDVSHLVHTCPASPEPHVCESANYLVHVTPGGPCRTPVTIRCGTTVATIDCRRHEPEDRQCPACKNTVIVLTEDYFNAGYEGPACVSGETV